MTMCNFNKINSVFSSEGDLRPLPVSACTPTGSHYTRTTTAGAGPIEPIRVKAKGQTTALSREGLKPRGGASQQVKFNKIKAAGSANTPRHNKILKVKAKLSVRSPTRSGGGGVSGFGVQAIQGELAAVGGVGTGGAAGVGAVGGRRVFGGVRVRLSVHLLRVTDAAGRSSSPKI